MKHAIKIISIALGAFGIGWYLGGVMPEPSSPIDEENPGVRSSSGYTFTNPLLECENNGSFAKQKYIPFEQDTLRRIQSEVVSKNPDIQLSVYFRNLNNGPWFGIGEDTRFLPASLMKVTLLISYLKWWDEDHTLLDKKIIIPTTGSNVEQMIAPKESLIPGQEYTVRQALYYLIVYSDNHAAQGLLSHIEESRQNQVFRDLSIPVPDGTNPDYTLSVKEYASFFRILYNASYLSRAASEAGLEILSASSFRDGLVAGVAPDIKVAHKFGEREFTDSIGKITNQLHDCGIVYHPNYPYLLCVMSRTESASLDELTKIIGETSRIVFDEVDKNYPYKK